MRSKQTSGKVGSAPPPPHAARCASVTVVTCAVSRYKVKAAKSKFHNNFAAMRTPLPRPRASAQPRWLRTQSKGPPAGRREPASTIASASGTALSLEPWRARHALSPRLSPRPAPLHWRCAPHLAHTGYTPGTRSRRARTWCMWGVCIRRQAHWRAARELSPMRAVDCSPPPEPHPLLYTISPPVLGTPPRTPQSYNTFLASS